MKTPKTIFLLFITLLFNDPVIGQAFAAQEVANAELNQNEAFISRYPQGLFADEIITISAGEDRFMALLQRQRALVPQGGLLIVHDQGHNLDWPQTVKGARQFLPEAGWLTLSISLPKGRFNSQAVYETQILDRIEAGLAELNDMGQLNVAFVGVGTGGYWLTSFMNERLEGQDNVGFALALFDYKPPKLKTYQQANEQLSQLTVPILDLFDPGSPFETNQGKWRKGAMLSKERLDYSQIRINRLSRNIYTQPDETTRRLWGWLKTNAAGQEADVNKKDNNPKF